MLDKLQKNILEELKQTLNELPYVDSSEGIIDFRVEQYPDLSVEEKRKLTNYIQSGKVVHGKLRDKWVIFSSDNVYMDKEEPEDSLRLPDDWFKYMYLAV